MKNSRRITQYSINSLPVINGPMTVFLSIIDAMDTTFGKSVWVLACRDGPFGFGVRRLAFAYLALVAD